MFWGAVALFALVMAFLAVSLVRPKALSGIKPMHWVVGGGLLMPIPILTALLVAALILGEQLLPRAGAAAPMRIEGRAEQWSWKFSYPDVPGAPSSEVLHLPAGEPVDIAITSEDVIHAFWIPRLGGKMDAIPGHINVLRIAADEPGVYRGICAEYCGPGHDEMGFLAQAHEAEEFAAAVGATP